ncbi:hypothetical protein GCM10027287_02040 [Bordetella muralis]|jgi:hypothetical protein
MLVASLSETIRAKVSQIVERGNSGANKYQSDDSTAQECSVDTVLPVRMGPGPHPRYRMISYDDMMLAD